VPLSYTIPVLSLICVRIPSDHSLLITVFDAVYTLPVTYIPEPRLTISLYVIHIAEAEIPSHLY